jgi:peptidoglycan hydrolase-like protein with peptidoglycan-binding domain
MGLLYAPFAQNVEIVRASTSSPSLRRGSGGIGVQRLQVELSRLGYPLVADGDFGANTEKAVIAYQTPRKLGADGVVGRGTIASLDQELGQLVGPPQAIVTVGPFEHLLFDGKTVSLKAQSGPLVLRVPAISGLPPNAPHLLELIQGGRTDLKASTDYTQAANQDVKDAGPIPEGTYELPLRPGMPYDKSAASTGNAGWGEGGWLLSEGFWDKMGNFFGGRSGFFLHHDGGNPGTSGCVGIKTAADFLEVKRLLVDAQTRGQTKLKIKVDYP